MPPLPVRCQRCGSVSVSGLLSPPDAFSSGNFEIPAEVISDPSSCPLCKAALTENSKKLARAAYRSLIDADLELDEAIKLLSLMSDQFRKGSAHSEVVSAIETNVPKASGLMKLVPPGDITGAIGLIISILALADDLVQNWIAPRTVTTTDNINRRSAKPLDLAIELSLNDRIPHSANNPGVVNGYWYGGAGEALHYYSFSTNPDARISYSGLISNTPGPFAWLLRKEHEIERFLSILFVSNDKYARSFANHYFSLSKLAAIDAVPILFARYSKSDIIVTVLSRGGWLDSFRKFRR